MVGQKVLIVGGYEGAGLVNDSGQEGGEAWEECVGRQGG